MRLWGCLERQIRQARRLKRRTCRRKRRPCASATSCFLSSSVRPPIFCLYPPFSGVCLEMDLFASSDADAASASASASGLSASQTTGLQASKSLPRKTRSACDRCHSQKLRCIKTGAQSSCDRCLKLKRLCRFGPRAARASPKHAEPIDPSSLVGIQQLISTATSLPNPNTHVDEITSDMDHTQWSFPSITTTTVSAAGGIFTHHVS